MKNLILRSLSGIVYVAVIVGCIIGGDMWMLALGILFGAVGILELQSAAMPHRRGALDVVCKCVDSLAVALLLAMVLIPSSTPFMVMMVLVAFFLMRGVLALYDRGENPFRAAAWSAMSVLYLGLPLVCMLLIYTGYGPFMVLAMFVLIWLNDTGAYCAGSLLGKHKMFPRLSPKKSWEGFVGGLIFCLAASVGAYFLFHSRFDPVYLDSIPVWLGLGALACVFSTWGDLFESLLKRNAGIKDSGKLIPGHGGILDRIDSLLFVAPACLLYLLLVGLCNV